jgi:hypothetical protein
MASLLHNMESHSKYFSKHSCLSPFLQRLAFRICTSGLLYRVVRQLLSPADNVRHPGRLVTRGQSSAEDCRVRPASAPR